MLAGGIARPPKRMLFAVVLLKAVASAQQEISELNGFWVGGGFQTIADLSWYALLKGSHVLSSHPLTDPDSDPTLLVF